MMTRSFVAALLVVFLGFLQLGTAAARPSAVEREISGDLSTNAKRFAVGLGPLTPRNLFNPSRVVARNQPSGLPVTGQLHVVNANTHASVGYISKKYAGPKEETKRFIVTTKKSDGMHVKFTPTTGPFDITITSPSSKDFPFLSFQGGNLFTGTESSATLHTMTRAKHTAPGSVPKNVGNAFAKGKSESSIWHYSSFSAMLTAQWINTDGSKPHTFLWYFPKQKGIFLIENPTEAHAYDHSSFPVDIIVV